MGERGATVSVLNRGVLPRRGQETPSSKLLAANRTEGHMPDTSHRGVRAFVATAQVYKCGGGVEHEAPLRGGAALGGNGHARVGASRGGRLIQGIGL